MNGIWQGGEFVLQSTIEERLARVTAERDRLKEALTPSEATKYAYMSEFVFQFGDQQANVPWTTIKEIMAAIRGRAEAELMEADQ